MNLIKSPICSATTNNKKKYPFDILKESITNEDQHKLMLDFGCGEGANMCLFSHKKYQCIGIDISSSSLKMAKRCGAVIQCTGTALPFKDNCFNLIVSEHVLHHIDDISLSLNEINRCIKPNGVLLINDIVEDNPIVRICRNLYPFYEGIPVKSRFYRGELLNDIQENGFRIEYCGNSEFKGFFTWFVNSKIPDKRLLLKILNPFLQMGDILTEEVIHFLEYFFDKNLSGDCFCLARKIH